MEKHLILKLIGLVLLTMLVLVAISFLEVAFYSYLINPGQEQNVYEDHANYAAPYISGIFGFLIFFLVTRYWGKKKFSNALKLAFLYPFTYLLLDVVLITASGASWSDFFLIFLIANAAKTLGSLLGYQISK